MMLPYPCHTMLPIYGRAHITDYFIITTLICLLSMTITGQHSSLSIGGSGSFKAETGCKVEEERRVAGHRHMEGQPVLQGGQGGARAPACHWQRSGLHQERQATGSRLQVLYIARTNQLQDPTQRALLHVSSWFYGKCSPHGVLSCYSCISSGLHACRDIMEGTYYPAVSLFTHPDQREGAAAAFNFGETLSHRLKLIVRMMQD